MSVNKLFIDTLLPTDKVVEDVHRMLVESERTIEFDDGVVYLPEQVTLRVLYKELNLWYYETDFGNHILVEVAFDIDSSHRLAYAYLWYNETCELITVDISETRRYTK